jgi:hypothetical protein
VRLKQEASKVKLRRLGWAGLELEADGQSIVIDHVLDVGIFSAFFGEPRDALIAPDPDALWPRC